MPSAGGERPPLELAVDGDLDARDRGRAVDDAQPAGAAGELESVDPGGVLSTRTVSDSSACFCT